MASALQNAASSKKRRFQPPITSYFVPSIPETDELSHHSYAAPTNTPTPALPANILSSLLGVGARVRKSVPEGYKTEQKKLTAYTIPAVTSSMSMGKAEIIPAQSTTTLYAELEPFCGIHKVGNYAVQTFPRPDEQYRHEMIANADDLETFSIPSSSQESNASSSSSFSLPPNRAKRAYDSGFEEDDVSSAATSGHTFRGGFLSTNIWQDTAIVPNHSAHTPTLGTSQRTILSPKLGQHRRRRIAAAATSNSDSSWKTSRPEQENEDPLTSTGDDMMDLDDFGEAAFLRRREEVDADYF